MAEIERSATAVRSGGPADGCGRAFASSRRLRKGVRVEGWAGRMRDREVWKDGVNAITVEKTGAEAGMP